MKYVLYSRVSSVRQGETGIGLEAQDDDFDIYIARRPGEIIGRFCDVKSGRSRSRKSLKAAAAMAKEFGATLIVAKIDRLARDAEYFLNLLNSGINIVFCDMPNVPEGAAGKLMLTQMAAFAEFESNRASERTCAAAAVVRKRGGPWGDEGRRKVRERAMEVAHKLKPLIDHLMQEGFTSRRELAVQLTAQTGRNWSPTSVSRILERIAA